jgi:hypothetical protein
LLPGLLPEARCTCMRRAAHAWVVARCKPLPFVQPFVLLTMALRLRPLLVAASCGHVGLLSCAFAMSPATNLQPCSCPLSRWRAELYLRRTFGVADCTLSGPTPLHVARGRHCQHVPASYNRVGLGDNSCNAQDNSCVQGSADVVVEECAVCLMHFVAKRPCRCTHVPACRILPPPDCTAALVVAAPVAGELGRGSGAAQRPRQCVAQWRAQAGGCWAL